MSSLHNRRSFLGRSISLAAAATAGPLCGNLAWAAEETSGEKNNPTKMKLGLVTYLWGRDWDLPTLIANCTKSEVLGVELRTKHAHGVEPDLSPAKRMEVKKRFDDSPITLLGPGTNECYDNPDGEKLKKSIEATKAFLKLSHDTGGSGVKVKPNSFHNGVDHKKTIEQIGRSLNTVGKFAGDLGQEIRLEVHGSCCELPTIKAIMDIADNPNVGVCWNCNGPDLAGKGLQHNFDLVKDRFGQTAHVRELNVGTYPYQELIGLFSKMNYDGWILLECRTNPEDRVAALIEQRKVFFDMLAKAEKTS